MTVPDPADTAPPAPPPAPAGGAVEEAVLEMLDDLAHDLGRHIRLPLALLPIDAPPAEVAAAASRAVQRTRTGPRGVFGADELLADFLEAVPDERRGDCAALEASVARAIELATTSPLPERDRLRVAFESVATQIAALASRWRAPAGR